jgi:hypothetical protein
MEDDNCFALKMNKEKIVSIRSTINFDEEYDDFTSFLNDAKDTIYRATYKAFNDLRLGIETVQIVVQAHVDETDFESVLEYTESDADVLKDVIIPYFEQKEDYETCSKILAIYSTFIKD